MKTLSPEVLAKVAEISAGLEVNATDLIKLIDFESGWNPQAKNPYSSARGLIQFIDSTAQSLGFLNSLELVTMHPTIVDQLQIVYEYLSQYYPFANKEELYLSVLLPTWRKKPLSTPLPADLQLKNPGIVTLQDYVNKVEGGKKINTGVVLLAGAAGIALLLMLSKRKK